MTRVGFQAMQLRWLLLGVLVAALLATACDDEEDGNGTAVADGTETPTATETATTTPDGTATGTPQQGSDQPGSGQQAQRYGQALQLALQDELGSTDVQELISEWNIDVTPDGDGLPEGSGTVEQGSQIYQTQCAVCHGADLGGGIGPQLVADAPEPWQPGDTPAIGNWWPYATTVWDYINRAMPFYEPGTLEPDEVYALTAFILAENQIIDEGEEMNRETLPQVEMPARDIYRACYPDACYEEYGHQDGQAGN